MGHVRDLLFREVGRVRRVRNDHVVDDLVGTGRHYRRDNRLNGETHRGVGRCGLVVLDDHLRVEGITVVELHALAQVNCPGRVIGVRRGGQGQHGKPGLAIRRHDEERVIDGIGHAKA